MILNPSGNSYNARPLLFFGVRVNNELLFNFLQGNESQSKTGEGKGCFLKHNHISVFKNFILIVFLFPYYRF